MELLKVSGNIGYSPSGTVFNPGLDGSNTILCKVDAGSYKINDISNVVMCGSLKPKAGDNLVLKNGEVIYSYIVNSVSGNNITATETNYFTVQKNFSVENTEFTIAAGYRWVKFTGLAAPLNKCQKGSPGYTYHKYRGTISVLGKNIINTKMVMEFVCENKSPLLQSARIKMFDTPSSTKISPDIYDSSAGYISNYAISTTASPHTLPNYNDECPEDCTVVIKDWDMDVVYTSYGSMEIFNDEKYTVNIILYKKNEFGVIRKYFLGSYNCAELFSKL